MSQADNEHLCPYKRFIAFDVSKEKMNWHEFGLKTVGEVAHKRRDLAKLVATFGADCFVVCEATGGYERLLLDLLAAAGVPCHRADASKAKHFIRSYGIQGKTDVLDARALSRYARERWSSLALWEQPSAEQEEVELLVARRQQLIAMRVAEQNRAGAPMAKRYPALLKSRQAVIKTLTTQIEAIDAALKALQRSSEPLKRKVSCMVKLKGIATTTALGLCGLMPELGTLSSKKAVALAGLAPHPQDSGLRQGYRKVRGGRRSIPRMLFMGALSASQNKGQLKDFYDRLIANGKQPLIALVAVMRKMIVILNAMLRDLATSHPAQHSPA
jgi:transposase